MIGFSRVRSSLRLIVPFLQCLHSCQIWAYSGVNGSPSPPYQPMSIATHNHSEQSEVSERRDSGNGEDPPIHPSVAQTRSSAPPLDSFQSLHPCHPVLTQGSLGVQEGRTLARPHWRPRWWKSNRGPSVAIRSFSRLDSISTGMQTNGWRLVIPDRSFVFSRSSVQCCLP